MISFSSFGLSPRLLDALTRLGYQKATEVQALSIPLIRQGQSILMKSPTGTGKTHAFLIPIVDRLIKKPELTALIISPTKELARQTGLFASTLTADLEMVRIRQITGGKEIEEDYRSIKDRPNLIIATPGRIVSLLQSSSQHYLKHVDIVTLDETDMLIDDGFLSKVVRFLDILKKPQVIAVTATLPQILSDTLNRYIDINKIISVDSSPESGKNITHYLLDIRHRPPEEALVSFLKQTNPYLALVFASKIETAVKVHAYLNAQGISAALLHGNLNLRERKNVLREIKSNRYSVIVASDIASRGLDIPDVSDVISVDFPHDPSYYMHRAGRTGRMNKTGNSFLFYNPDDRRLVNTLTELKIVFKNAVLKSEELKGEKERPVRKRKEDEELSRDIKKVLAQHSSKVVKPGYKKKRKEALAKVKQQHKQIMIRKEILKQKKALSKKEKNNG